MRHMLEILSAYTMREMSRLGGNRNRGIWNSGNDLINTGIKIFIKFKPKKDFNGKGIKSRGRDSC